MDFALRRYRDASAWRATLGSRSRGRDAKTAVARRRWWAAAAAPAEMVRAQHTSLKLIGPKILKWPCELVHDFAEGSGVMDSGTKDGQTDIMTDEPLANAVTSHSPGLGVTASIEQRISPAHQATRHEPSVQQNPANAQHVDSAAALKAESSHQHKWSSPETHSRWGSSPIKSAARLLKIQHVSS